LMGNNTNSLAYLACVPWRRTGSALGLPFNHAQPLTAN
jgi:hypothetical protein